jgi:tetrapyrrole methylase family protein/MazG family protein
MPSQITIVGLGSGNIEQISVGVWNILKQAENIYVRTEDHPAVVEFKNHGISYTSFDDMYLTFEQFEEVYEAIVNQLIHLAKLTQKQVVYAVPGHPMVAETTVQLLSNKCRAEGIELNIWGSESFLDRAFLAFGFDPLDGFQLLDATRMSRFTMNPQLQIIVGQVYDIHTASDVKLTLLEVYPHDYEIYIGHYLGIPSKERIEKIPLFELDHANSFGNQSLIWVPKSEALELQLKNFHRLHEIIHTLRSPGGCPWDREQTHTSLRKHLIEESYEVIDAIDEDDPDHLREELGDLLLQVMLHAQIEEEAGIFTVYDVIATLNEKLIRRHPHVFGDTHVENTDEVMVNWNKIKQEEKKQKGEKENQHSVLNGIPQSLPSMMKALKLQSKAAHVGFDWNEIQQVVAKVQEELRELLDEIIEESEQSNRKRTEELGDLLFAIINLSRFLRIDPDEALSFTNRKFVERFSYIEKTLVAQGKSFEQVDLQYMDNLWNESKKMKNNVKK